MKTRYLIINTVLIIFIVAGLGVIFRQQIFDLWDTWMSEPVPEPISYDQLVNRRHENANTSNANVAFNQNANAEVSVPDEINLDVPFTTQSPFAEWTEQDNESCEEAAALIVHYYWQNKTFTQDIAKAEIQTVVDFENETLGFYKDTTAEETARVIRELWGYRRVDVVYDITIEDIKEEVAQGRPVIVPSAGRLLHNPNFKQPGPPYHMLVVRGWTEDMIITNDPGTRKGENYQYTPDVLYNAIHDWNGSYDSIEQGRKAMIVVWPNE